MNVSVLFEADKLPLAYRRCALSIIKESIRKADEDLYHFYYTENNNNPKPYVYSLYLCDYAIREDEIDLSRFWLNVSSAEPRFIIPFLNGLQQTKVFQYKNYRFTRRTIRYHRETAVRGSKIVVSTRSPILVEDENRQPLEPSHPSYNEELNKIMNKKSMTLRGRPLSRALALTPLQVKRVVVKESNEEYEKAVAEGRAAQPYLYFTAFGGKFLLEGATEDLQWVLDCGAALRSAQGFGHLRLESEVNP